MAAPSFVGLESLSESSIRTSFHLLLRLIPTHRHIASMEIGVEYKRFIVRAFEQEFGKWRARIWRVDGAPIALAGRRKLKCFVTGIDANTAPNAMLMAMDAIDAGTFSANRSHRERYWRCLDRASETGPDRKSDNQ